MSQLPELKTLLTQCQSTNGAVSITACQAIVVLAANGVIAIPATISNLTACLAGAKLVTKIHSPRYAVRVSRRRVAKSLEYSL